MLIFLCICAGLTTASLIVVAVYLIQTLTQLRRTAKIMESLASNANEKVDTFTGMFDTIRSVSNGVRSGWFKSLQFALGLISAHKAQRQQKHASHDSTEGSPASDPSGTGSQHSSPGP